ncbi:MAG: DMT family transporter [Eubacterium sp.]|nr:DMT family transporter [Eubacterium sp.]
MKSIKVKHSFFLALGAFIWGTAFVAQSIGGDNCGPYTFNCIRSILGGLILIPVIMILNNSGLSKNIPKTKENRKTLIIGGILCGICLCLGSNVQQLGLYLGASAGKAGFLTACYILIVPILGIFLKKKCGINIWVGVILTLAGLYLLCFDGTLVFKTADLLLLSCAFFFALHILVIDYFSPKVDGIKLSCIQFFVCGILTAIPMFLFDMKRSFMNLSVWANAFTSISTWIPLFYAGFLSCGVAYTLQIIGQVGMNPTVASLILSLESVFAVLSGWVILGETMGARELIGCGLIFTAIILAQMPAKSNE